MDTGSSQYDAELQMFTDEPREPDLVRLRFLRWLAEHGRLEHETAGDPSGAYVADASKREPQPV
jgi:hypothetical protein